MVDFRYQCDHRYNNLKEFIHDTASPGACGPSISYTRVSNLIINMYTLIEPKFCIAVIAFYCYPSAVPDNLGDTAPVKKAYSEKTGVCNVQF